MLSPWFRAESAERGGALRVEALAVASRESRVVDRSAKSRAGAQHLPE